MSVFALRQSGNIMLALFAAIGAVGVVGASSMAIMKGPVRGMHNVTQKTIAENNMIASGKLAIMTASNQPSSGDCDSDNTVEPIAWSNTGSGPKPSGGGYLPASIGASLQDPWGNTYGYCAWDHGAAIQTTCATPTQRLRGEADSSGYVIAVISSGADRTFQTTCANAPTYVNKVSGSDDIILAYTYDEAQALSGGLWNLKSSDINTAEIKKDIEVKNAANNVVFGVDSTTDINRPSIKVDYIKALSQSRVEMLSPLTVASDISISNNVPEGPRLRLVNPSKTGATTLDWSIWNMTGSYGNGLSFWRYHANGTNAGPALWLGDDGNVGIGTQAPGRKFHIISQADHIQRLQNSATTDYTEFVKRTPSYVAPDAFSIYNNTGGSFYHGLTVTRTGNVGIGTETPSNKLHVTGNIGATGWIGAGCEGACESGGGYSLLYADGTGVMTASVQAPIYYDLNNTSFYTDPHSVSRMNRIDVDHMYDINDYNYYIDMNNVSYFNDIRPNITYDRQDTYWFSDPNGTSRLNHLHVNIMYDYANTGYYVQPRATSSFNVVYAHGYYYHSDLRLKKDIQTIAQDRLADLYKLNGVSFNWKETEEADIGLIAQEVEKYFPEMVSVNSEGVKGIKYGNMVALLLEAVKSQKREIEALKKAVKLSPDAAKSIENSEEAKDEAEVKIETEFVADKTMNKPEGERPIVHSSLPLADPATVPMIEDTSICNNPEKPSCLDGEITDENKFTCQDSLYRYIFDSRVYNLCIRGDTDRSDHFKTEYNNVIAQAEQKGMKQKDAVLDEIIQTHVLAFEGMRAEMTKSTPVKPNPPQDFLNHIKRETPSIEGQIESRSATEEQAEKSPLLETPLSMDAANPEKDKVKSTTETLPVWVVPVVVGNIAMTVILLLAFLTIGRARSRE